MPCYDSRNSPSYVREETAYEVRKDCRHNSDVAALLCAVMKQAGPIRRGDFCDDIPGLAEWWREHQVRDACKAKAKKPKRK